MDGTRISLVVVAYFLGSALPARPCAGALAIANLFGFYSFVRVVARRVFRRRAPLRLRSGQAPPAREARALPYPRYPCNPWFLMLCFVSIRGYISCLSF